MSIYIDSHQDLFVITLHMFGFNSWNMIVIVEQRVSASEARLMIALHSRFCYICPHLTQADATVVQAWYCYCCASLMAAPWAEWYIVLQLHSTLFSGFLRSTAFLRRRSTASRSAFIVAGVLPPPFCCVLVQWAVASCSAFELSTDSHSELSISTNVG